MRNANGALEKRLAPRNLTPPARGVALCALTTRLPTHSITSQAPTAPGNARTLIETSMPTYTV